MDELEALHARWSLAWCEHDDATIDALMAPGFRYVAPTGEIVDRDTVLAMLRSPTPGPLRGESRDVSVMRLSRTAAVIMSSQGRAGDADREGPDDMRQCTTILQQRDGHWQVAMEQCTSIVR